MNHRSTLSVIALSVAFAANAAAALSFRVISTADVTGDVIARDVRWASPSEVFVSLGRQGVIRRRVDSAEQAVVVMPPADRGGYPLSGKLAVGSKHLFVAAEMAGVGWIPLTGSERKVGQRFLRTMTDIDAEGDTAAMLGAESGPIQGLARDGAIAWTGSLSKGLADMHPLMKGRSDPGGKDMARCSLLETGALRFMRDGSLIIVPGSEPGIYRYDPASGKLLQTWDTAPLGIVDNCDLDETERLEIGRDFPRRIDWFASRVILDEILPLATGPALVLRRVENGVTKWEVVTLPYRGKSERVALPLTMPTPRAHVRGDARGDRVVLIAFDDKLPQQRQPVAPPRLVVLAIGR